MVLSFHGPVWQCCASASQPLPSEGQPLLVLTLSCHRPVAAGAWCGLTALPSGPSLQTVTCPLCCVCSPAGPRHSQASHGCHGTCCCTYPASSRTVPLQTERVSSRL